VGPAGVHQKGRSLPRIPLEGYACYLHSTLRISQFLQDCSAIARREQDN
jgi:hypothetical protein